MRGLVIKPGDSPCIARGAIGLELRDVAHQADAILTAARAEARRITEQARAHAEAERQRIQENAHDEGYERGRREGFDAGSQTALNEARAAFAVDHGAIADVLSKLVRELTQRREALYAAARRDVVILAVAIASRICRSLAIRDDAAPEAALQAAEDALALLRGATQAVVHVHPTDAHALERLAERLGSDMGRSVGNESSHFRILEDPDMERGGIRLTAGDAAGGSACRVDASINTRLERIADELVSHWRPRAAELGLQA